MPKPRAYDSTRRKERKERKKEKPVPDRSPMGTSNPAAYVHRTPSLTSPTLVFSKNSRTASVYLSSDGRSRIDVLLGLAVAYLTLYPKPFLLLKGASAVALVPQAFPTFP